MAHPATILHTKICFLVLPNCLQANRKAAAKVIAAHAKGATGWPGRIVQTRTTTPLSQAPAFSAPCWDLPLSSVIEQTGKAFKRFSKDVHISEGVQGKDRFLARNKP
jgi:hypothetical protein